MSVLYELIGRAWVRAIRVRYRRQIRAGIAAGAAAILAAGYLAAKRQPPEG